MNVIITCKCGNKFRVTLEGAEQEVKCPGCGRAKKVKAPPAKQPAPVPAPPIEEEEVKLQDLKPVATQAKVEAPPQVDEEIKLQEIVRPEPTAEEVKLQEIAKIPVVQEVIEEDDGSGIPLDANDGLQDLYRGPGMYGSYKSIRLEDIAPCIAYGCNGDWAVAGQGEDVLILDMKKHKIVDSFEEHEIDVLCVAMSATESLAISGDDDGEIRLWDAETGKRKKKITAHEDAVNAVALSPDGSRAVTGGEDGQIHLWNLETGKRREVEHSDWYEHDQEVTYVAFSRDGRKFLAGGSRGRVSMWETETGKRIKRYSGVEMPISCLRLSDEGGEVTATTEPIAYKGSSFLTIAHWEAATGKPINELNVAVQTIPCCIAPDRGGRRVIIGGGADYPWMGIWSIQDGRCLYAYDQFRGTPLHLAVSPHNNHILASLNTACLQVFGLEVH